jgi:hypothetical protein
MWGIWFNYNCFALPASPFVPRDAPAYLDYVRTMGANDVDLSLQKFQAGRSEESPL